MTGAMMTYPSGLVWVSNTCAKRFRVLCSTASGIAKYVHRTAINSSRCFGDICCSRNRHSSCVEQPSHCFETRVLHGGGMEFFKRRQWHDPRI